MAIYRHLKKVGQPKQDNMNEYVTPPTLVVDVPVPNESALSSVTVSLSDVIVPGEDDDPIERLMATTKSDLSLADTWFGRAVATRKRELEASVDFMSREERERMIRKLHKLNEEEAPAMATGMEEEHTGMLGQMDGV